MSDTAVVVEDGTIPLGAIEKELARQLGEGEGEGEGEGKADAQTPLLRARLSNLVIYCNRSEQAETVIRAVPEIVAVHPARVLLVVGEPGAEAPLKASLNVWCQLGSKRRICSEQVTLRAGGPFVEQLPFAVRGLLIGDLPTNLWWAAGTPPPLAGHLLYDLAEHAQQIIYDSVGWTEPARGVAATCAWLTKFERGPRQGPWRVASDLNWRRLKFWRRVLAQALDPNTAPRALDTVSEVLVEHGPHAVIQAWELVSWLASRLGWKVQLGKVEPGVEIAWQVVAPHGSLRVRIRRCGACALPAAWVKRSRLSTLRCRRTCAWPWCWRAWRRRRVRWQCNRRRCRNLWRSSCPIANAIRCFARAWLSRRSLRGRCWANSPLKNGSHGLGHPIQKRACVQLDTEHYDASALTLAPCGGLCVHRIGKDHRNNQGAQWVNRTVRRCGHARAAPTTTRHTRAV
jgi:glucose-6-phosphate dehydrogenase assembly protein OpcA